MRTRAVTLFIFFNAGLINTAYSQNMQPLEYVANYEASANGLAATATRSLRKTDESAYRLSNSLEASLAGQTLASLEQSSELLLQDQQIVPLNYSYQLSGVSRASHAIFFNWDANMALSTKDDESWQLELENGVMDQLSYQLALRQALLLNAAGRTNFAFSIIDGDAIERHEYRLVSEERISTPLGEMNTLKLERVREANDERMTEIWLAADWNFLLTRIEQITNSGLRIILELKSAEIEGEAVKAIR